MSDPERVPGLHASARVYRALLELYPSAFRDRYADDAVELFVDRYREAFGRWGARGVAVLWLRTIPNVVKHGLLEHASEARRRGSVVLRGEASGAVRSVIRSRAASAFIVLTLAAGMGANVALFSILRGVLIRPLPYPEADRLVQITEVNVDAGDGRYGPSPWNFADWDGAVDGFASMTAWYLTSGTFRTEETAEEVRTAQVTAGFLDVLGVEPMLGRGFRGRDVDRYGPIVLSHRLWQRLYGGDPTIVGRQVRVSGSTHDVAGVMGPEFAFPDESVDAWLAWDLRGVYAAVPEARTWRFLGALARLGPGVSLTEGEAQLDAVSAALAEAHPEANRGWSTQLRPFHDVVVGDVRTTLWVAFGAVTLLLLIACANVASVLLARVPARSHEFAVRSALGASRRRVLGALLAESVVLALLAGVLGMVIAQVLLALLVAVDAGKIPRLADVTIDGSVYLFTLAVAGATSIVFGMVPALQVVRAPSLSCLRHGGRTTASTSQRRAREVFVAAQIALALVLLSGARLLQSSLERLRDIDPGFDSGHVATFRVALEPGHATVAYYDGLLQQLASLPGVERVGAAQTLPLNPVGNDFFRPYRRVGSATPVAEAPAVQMRIVTAGYVDAMGMRLIAGDDFTGMEAAGGPLVGLINRRLAEDLWPDGGAVGESLEVEFREGWQRYRITGVVEDVRHYGPRESVRPELFVLHRQIPYLAMNIVVRTQGDPGAMTETLRRAVLAHPPGQPAYDFVTLDALRAQAVAEERFLAVLLGAFSVIALLLAAAGIYGLISYMVSQRRREIGVRMAIGAPAAQVVRAVMVQALLLAGAGLLAGYAIVAVAGSALEGVLFGVHAMDPGVSSSVGAFVLVVAAASAYLPAWRASRISPVEALRAD